MAIKEPHPIKKAKVVDGVLHVREPKDWKTYPGVGSYDEATPPELFLLDDRALRERFRRSRLPWRSPGGWDLTAGSATGAATLGPMGWEVVSTDLTNPNAEVKFLDARHLGNSPFHKAPLKIRGRQPGPTKTPEREVVAYPHAIFLDVSTRGSPSHAEQYGHGHNAALDFASLGRDDLVATIADVVVRALVLVQPRGCVSLTVREGLRAAGRILTDDGLGQAILDLLLASGAPFEVVRDYRIVYTNPRNQAFAGRSRAPIRHLLLGRPT